MSGFAETDEAIEVRREDQERINEFGRNTNRLNELEDDKKKLRQELDNLEDAEQEIMLADGDEEDATCISVGGTFVVSDEDHVEEFLNRKRDVCSAEFDKLNDEMGSLSARQSELKSLLYARFGSNINLET